MGGKRQLGLLYPLLATGAGTAFPISTSQPQPALLHLEKVLKRGSLRLAGIRTPKRLVLHPPGLVT